IANHRYAIRYHFPAGCSATAGETQIAASQPGGDLRIQAFGSVETTPRIEQGWVSRCYGLRESAPVGVIEAEGSGPQEFVSILAVDTASAPKVEPWLPALVGVDTSAKSMGHHSSNDSLARRPSAGRDG